MKTREEGTGGRRITPAATTAQAGFAPAVPHFTNFPFAPRHFFAAGAAAFGGGHLMN